MQALHVKQASPTTLESYQYFLESGQKEDRDRSGDNQSTGNQNELPGDLWIRLQTSRKPRMVLNFWKPWQGQDQRLSKTEDTRVNKEALMFFIF